MTAPFRVIAPSEKSTWTPLITGISSGECCGNEVASGRARGGGVDFRSLGLMLVADFGIAAAFSAARSSCRRSSPLVPNESGEIVGEVGHTDLGSGAGDADCADKQTHPGFLLCEDVLDEGADL